MAGTTPSADLTLLVDAARRAGDVALGYFRKAPTVWLKAGGSPVSEADVAVDLFLKDMLLAARPDYGWLSEETEPFGDGGAPERFFVVDPIDGTRSFLRGEETWCVSIAVIEKGRPIAGVVDAAARSEVFSALAGGSAELNGVTLEVRPRLADGRLEVALPDGYRRLLDQSGKDLLSVMPNAPSLAYRLSQVAAGRLHGTIIRPHANDWDIAAGDLILERAGGALVDIGGAPGLYKIEGKRHGLLVAGAKHALPSLMAFAGAMASP